VIKHRPGPRQSVASAGLGADGEIVTESADTNTARGIIFPCYHGIVPRVRLRVNINDRSYTALRAVGRKTRRAQETVYSFRLLRAGFELFRACATRLGYLDAQNRWQDGE